MDDKSRMLHQLPCSILIVDDAKFIRDGLKDILSKHVLVTEIYEAENGAKAIEVYEKFVPDLVIVDVYMPKMDGMETLHSILKLNQNAKIIMITGVEHKYMMHQAVRQGAKDFIMKPFSESIVVEVVTRVLGLK